MSIADSTGVASGRAGLRSAIWTCCRLAIREGSVSVAVGFTWNGRLRSRRVPFHVERSGRCGCARRPFHVEPRRRKTSRDGRGSSPETQQARAPRRTRKSRSQEHGPLRAHPSPPRAPGRTPPSRGSRGTGRGRTRVARRPLLPTDRRAATRSAPTTQTSAPPESPPRAVVRAQSCWATTRGGGRSAAMFHVERVAVAPVDVERRPTATIRGLEASGRDPSAGHTSSRCICGRSARARGGCASRRQHSGHSRLPCRRPMRTSASRPRRTRTCVVPWEGACTVRSRRRSFGRATLARGADLRTTWWRSQGSVVASTRL